MELDKIEIATEYKLLQVREITDNGEYHRRVLSPDADVSGEAEEIQEVAEEYWTDEMKDKWATHQAEQEAKPTE